MTAFHDLTRQQRLKQLQAQGYLNAAAYIDLLKKPALNDELITAMTENALGQFNLPFGVAPNFLIDGKTYVVPMVTEEPSVIAAASNGAKRVQRGGGFTVIKTQHLVKAQLILTGVADIQKLAQALQAHDEDIFCVAQQAHPSIVERGGGLQSWQLIDDKHDFAQIELWIDPVAAFGANIANTIAEGITDYLQTQVFFAGVKILAAILSNSGSKMITQIQAAIPWRFLSTSQLSGEEVATRICKLHQFAQINEDRATTENKGILNGVFAVALATGNDLRALSSAVSSYLQETTSPVLSHWLNDKNAHCLRGELTLPLPIGIVGGAISSLPGAQTSLALLQNPTLSELMGVIAAVGLANNLSALRALVSSGIQAGHMRLQRANLAIQAGAKPAEIASLTAQLNALQISDLKQAQAALAKQRRKRSLADE